jgi:hypothetical protein
LLLPGRASDSLHRLHYELTSASDRNCRLSTVGILKGMIDSSCFLCSPDANLVVARSKTAYAMVGLGPFTTTYAIIASRVHLPSLADLATADPTAIAEIERLRRELESIRGPLLMTEHGRVPVCRDDGDQHDAHCFHAHGLIFAQPSSVLRHALSYYSRSAMYPNLSSALEAAAKEEAYLLCSEGIDRYHILSGPLNVPRQLTRTLAALSAGEGRLADWRINPRKPEAMQMAETLRAALRERVRLIWGNSMDASAPLASKSPWRCAQSLVTRSRWLGSVS